MSLDDINSIGTGILSDVRPEWQAEREEIVAGLQGTPKSISPKYFYDELGSRLFEQICDTPEYYLRRTELSILEQVATELSQHLPEPLTIVEPGAGAMRKVGLLLEACSVERYCPIDISGEFLAEQAAQLISDHPGVPVHPVAANIFDDRLADLPLEAGPRLVFYPGSSIGNFEPVDAVALLQKFQRMACPGGHLLIGVDLVKDAAVLERAYNDAAGVTAAFNCNIITSINRYLDGAVPTDPFAHRSFFDPDESRIEMRLVCDQDLQLDLDGQIVSFAAAEEIVTEYSYKYTIERFGELAAQAGFAPREVWTDPDDLFSVHLLQVTEG